MSLSLTGVARLSKSNIGSGVRGLHGPAGEDAGAAMNGISDFDGDLRVLREPDVHARAETDEANAFSAEDGFADFLPGDDAPGDEAGDLLELDVAAWSGEGEDVLFVLCGGFGVPCGEEFAGTIIDLRDSAG